MNEIIEKEILNIKDMIYDINGVEVMLDSEISRTKCHNHLYNKMITHYANVKPISVFNNYAGIICIIYKGEI